MNDIERAIEVLKEQIIKNAKTLETLPNKAKERATDLRDIIKACQIAISALEKQLNGAWIPFKTEYDEDYNMDMLQGEIPDDEQEILVTDGECVWSDTFMRDGMECYLDSGNDLIITVKAWMKLPEPYKEVENE